MTNLLLIVCFSVASAAAVITFVAIFCLLAGLVLP